MKYFIVFAIVTLIGIADCYSQDTEKKRSNDSSIVMSDGTKLFLKISGKGPPCIFVHGGPGAWSRSFEVLGGSALEDSLTMYYYDQRGSGRSSSPLNKDYSLLRMVEDIENIRKATGAQKVYLLAHSFGGVLAYNYAMRYPENVEGLILLNATLSVNHSLRNQIEFVNRILGTNFTPSNEENVISIFTTAAKELREKGYGYKISSSSKSTVDRLDCVDNSVVRNYDFGKIALSMAAYLADFTLNSNDLKTPVLVITGTTDHNVGPGHYKLFNFQNQSVKVIEGGHLLYYEKNAEFVKVIWDFLQHN